MTITPLAVYFLYFIFSHPDSELCAPETRSNDCFSEYQPVCALYTGDSCHSQTGFCYKTLNNACIACSDDTIIGYVPGECQQPTIPQVCKKIQRGLNCEDEHDDQLVCAYSKPTRFKGHKALIARTLSNSCEACSSEQVVFHVPGECQQFSSFGGCIDRRTDECYDDQAGPLCVYYRGEDCTGELCRRTELNSCNVCQDSTVLFYVQGACPGFQLPSEDEIVDNGPEPQYIIPELEAVIQEDGTTVYEEVDEPKEEPGECFPELEAVLLEDGTTIFVPRDEPKEVTQEYEPVVQFDGPVDYDKVETLTEKIIEMNPEDSKIASVLKEDELLISEQLKSLQPDQPSEGGDCYVEPQDYIPELEAVVQVDGSVIYEELKNPDVECVVEEQTFIPELEAIVQADGTVVYEEFKPSEEGGDCYVEPQDYIPELEAVVQPDGSIVYEEVEPSEESTFTDNEEALLVPSEEEEKIGALPFIIQVIDSRLLVNEPSN